MHKSLPIAALAAALLSTPAHASADDFCPAVSKKGVLELDFNPAFLHVDRYDTALGFKVDGLTISSFYNAFVAPGGHPPIGFFERDLVARIPFIDWIDFDHFAADDWVEPLTDLTPGMPKTVWPNDAVRAPDGVFPFEAVVIPQGFHPAGFPGRLTAIDMSSDARTEYVIHQSTQAPGGFTFPGDPSNSPRFYHKVLFIDMDGDGLKDLVTVRSGFRVGAFFYPPFGELVWFKNPGAHIDPQTPWQETVLWGGPAAGFLGPDINLAAHDFDGDGVPEIVATHFFTGAPTAPGAPPPMSGKITLYGAPIGGTWADVDAMLFKLPRVADISDDQGFPFDVQIADLDGDGRADILATNHQPDNCSPQTSSPVPGRVYALEPPASGDVFVEPWTTHILLDDIRPQPSTQPVNPPGRLAPGLAQVFWPMGILRGITRPHIVVGGDEAGKVWVLRPGDGWSYDAAVIFDINDFYGPGATQTPLADPFGITISTIGGIAVRNTLFGFGPAELYVPVFEGKDIHVFTYAPGKRGDRVECVDDVTLTCTP